MTSVPHPGQDASASGATVVVERFSRDGLFRAGRRLIPCVLALLPLGLLAMLLSRWSYQDLMAFDFHRSFRPAAEAVLNGSSPYPPPVPESMAERSAFVYLPLAAFLFAPFTVLQPVAADLVITVLMVLCLLVSLRVAGVRDWRCYGIAMLSPAVVGAIQNANLTLPLLLALAAMWSLRRRAVLSGVVLALTLATKLFLWPLAVWLVATGRYRAAVASAVATAALVGGSWAAIGFAGLRDYPALLQVLAESLEHDSYTIFALVSDLGAPDLVARTVGIAVALAVLVSCWVLGRRGDDARSFTLAIVAALLFTPIVWLHYFTLLLVPVAIAHRRLSLLWAAPLLVWPFVEGYGNGTSFQTAWTLGVAALVALVVLRAESGPTRPVPALQPAAAAP